MSATRSVRVCVRLCACVFDHSRANTECRMLQNIVVLSFNGFYFLSSFRRSTRFYFIFSVVVDVGDAAVNRCE